MAKSKRYKLFEKISKETWTHICYNHKANIEVPEIGLSYDIVARIRNEFHKHSNIGVWANLSLGKEKECGNDIDIFVEIEHGKYIWFALQVKVLKVKNKYDIKSAQLENLKRLSDKAKCKCMYLLYNGKRNYTYTGIDKCGKCFNEKQYGCSLVELTAIDTIISGEKKPKFEDFHPQYAQPWRTIFCDIDTSLETYSHAQIQESLKGYYPLPGSNPSDKDATMSKELISDINIINDLSAKAERNPSFRIILKN